MSPNLGLSVSHSLIQMNTLARILTQWDGNTFNSPQQSGQASCTNQCSLRTWGVWSTSPHTMSSDPQNNPKTRQDNFKSFSFRDVKSEAQGRERKYPESGPKPTLPPSVNFSWCMINSFLMSILISLCSWCLSVAATIILSLQWKESIS